MHLPGLDVDLMDIGPLSRSAGDLAHLLQVLIGADPVVGIGAQPLLRQPDKLLTELRIGVWADDPHCPTSSDVLGALQYAADEIARAGGNVDDHAQPAFSLEEAWEVSFRLWVAASSARTDDDEFTRLSNLAVDGNEPNHVAVIRAAAETMSHRDWLRLDQRRRELLGDWMRFFEDIDLLLCPVIPVVAPEHDSTSDLDAVASVDHRLARHIDVDGTQRPYLDQLTWNILTNAPGLPVTVAPIGITPAGLPIGAQLVGPRYADLRTIRAAGELAELIEGYRRPAGW
jgi:amidase